MHYIFYGLYILPHECKRWDENNHNLNQMLMFMIHPLNHQLYTCTFTLKNVSWLKITLLRLKEDRYLCKQMQLV